MLGFGQEGKVKLLDTNDRTFTLANGEQVVMTANLALEVPQGVADELLAAYPYLQVIE